MTCGVYEVWCGPYFYQGSSKNIPRRWRDHRNALKNGKHTNPKFQAAYNKYGWTDSGVLVECEEHTLTVWEQAYLDTNWGDEKFLNLSEVAGRPASMKGKKHTDEARAKISAFRTGRPLSESHKAAVSATLTGKKHTDEARAKVSAAQKGVPKSPEHRAKLAAANKGKPFSAERRAKIAATLKGKQPTDEARAKMSASQKARHARSRAEAENNEVLALFGMED